LLASGLVFRSVIACFLPPGFDEAYYFLYAQHLDWSYFDHPLAVAFSTGMGLWLTGIVSPFTLRLGALGLFTASLWLLYRTGCWLFGDRAGWLSAVVASLSPLFLLTFGTLSAPDNALIFCWTLTLYLGAREFFPDYEGPYKPTSRIAWLGLTVGLACLSKYHGVLLGLGLVGFCGFSRWRALRSRWMLLSVFLFGLCWVPILYWNAQHDWISFRFQLGDRFALASGASVFSALTEYSLTNLLGVSLAEIGFLFPTIGLPLWWVTLTAFRTTQRQRAQVQFVLWTGLPTALGFTLIGGLTHIYPAWPAPGLWCLTLLLGQAAMRWPKPRVRRWLQGTGLLVGTLLLFALTHITLGTLQKPGQYALFGGFVAPQQDPSTALIDVMALRRQLSELEAFGEAIATTDFVLTHEFWLSGYVAMALPPLVDLPVSAFTEDPRGHAFWFSPPDWIGKNALFLSLADFDQSVVVDEIFPYFQSVTLIDTVDIKRGNAVTETFYLYRAHRMIKPYPYPY